MNFLLSKMEIFVRHQKKSYLTWWVNLGNKWNRISVFEIARRTGARDQQKQRRSSKTIVYAGPKDQQSVLVFGNSHFPNIVPNMFQIQKSLVT